MGGANGFQKEENGVVQVDFSNRDQTKEVLEFTVVNYADDAVYGILIDVECENISGHQSMCEADNSALQSGQNVSFQLIPEDFAKEIQDGSKATIRLRVMDSDGNMDEVQGEVYADLFWGNKYKLNLSGNSDEGYFLGQ